MKRIIKKLRSRAGESIGEVLVALLISVLGVSMLVGMIGASVNLIDKSTSAMKRQYERANAVPEEGSFVSITLTLKGSAEPGAPTTVPIPVRRAFYTDPDTSEKTVIYYIPAGS